MHTVPFQRTTRLLIKYIIYHIYRMIRAFPGRGDLQICNLGTCVREHLERLTATMSTATGQNARQGTVTALASYLPIQHRLAGKG